MERPPTMGQDRSLTLCDRLYGFLHLLLAGFFQSAPISLGIIDFLLFNDRAILSIRRTTKMANYHKPELKIVQELKDIATKLRIHSIQATQASKSGIFFVNFAGCTAFTNPVTRTLPEFYQKLTRILQGGLTLLVPDDASLVSKPKYQRPAILELNVDSLLRAFG